MKYVNGWIQPDGSYVECDTYGHLEAATKLDVPQGIRDYIDRELDVLKSIADSSNELQASGEHPAWHEYDIHEGTVNANLWRMLLDAGYARVSKYQSDKTLCVETSAYKPYHRRRYTDFAIINGCDSVKVEILVQGRGPQTIQWSV